MAAVEIFVERRGAATARTSHEATQEGSRVDTAELRLVSSTVSMSDIIPSGPDAFLASSTSTFSVKCFTCFRGL